MNILQSVVLITIALSKYDEIIFSFLIIDRFNNQLKDSIFGASKSKLGSLEMVTIFNSLRGNMQVLVALKKYLKGLNRITGTITHT